MRTFEIASGISRFTMPDTLAFGEPGWPLARWCFCATFTFSTTTRPSAMRTILPRRPLSLPVITMTSSPFLSFCMFVGPARAPSEHFRRERNDLHESLGPQLARHGPEDAGADRLELVRQEHRRVAVEADERTVRAAHAAPGAHHHRVVDLALLHLAARNRVLDA